MQSAVKEILYWVLTYLYESTGFSLLIAFLFMFFYKAVRSKGLKETLIEWIVSFKSEPQFRKTFFLALYSALILSRTVLNREIWSNPLKDVMGGWWIYNTDGKITGECLSNFILFIPFTILLLWTYRERIIGEEVRLTRALWQSTIIVFIFSFTIEMLQLFLRLGTWQLSDLFYNTLGGFIGGLIYWIGYRIQKHNKT